MEPSRKVAAPDAPPPPAALWHTLDRYGVAHTRHLIVAGQRLARADTAIAQLWFPVSTILLVARQTPLDPVPLTVGLVGPEGMVGSPALLGVDDWTHDAIALAAGDVVAVATAELRAAVTAAPALHALLLRVVHNQFMQLAQSVVANLGHSLERRLARWLTMLHDRVAGDTIAVTHDQLAQLLNVRRASVTDALHVLEGERLVRAVRGEVHVRDRVALQARAGQSYGLSEDNYRRHVGPFGKRSD